MIAYRATLDVPRELLWFAANLLPAERHRCGTPRGSRALTCFWQAVLGLRWFRDRTAPDALARDHGISRATAYRYLEVTTVLAQEAPDLNEPPERAHGEGLPHVILDGKVIPADRCREKTISVKDEVTGAVLASANFASAAGSTRRSVRPGRLGRTAVAGGRSAANSGRACRRTPRPSASLSGSNPGPVTTSENCSELLKLCPRPSSEVAGSVRKARTYSIEQFRSHTLCLTVDFSAQNGAHFC